MTINSDIRERARKFAEKWKDKGSEKSDADNFWEDLLYSVFGVERPFDFIVKQKKTDVDVYVSGKGEAVRKKYIYTSVRMCDRT